MSRHRLPCDQTPWSLNGWRVAGLPLAAIVALGPDHSFGLAWSRAEVHVFTVDGGHAADAHGSTIDLESCFEARVFGDWGELRWLLDADRGSFSVAIGVSPPTGVAGSEAIPPQAGDSSIEVTHVLWGSGVLGSATTTAAGTWAAFAEHRIGTRQWPVADVQAQDRGLLVTREYIRFDGQGNAAIAEELLVGFRRLPATATKESS